MKNFGLLDWRSFTKTCGVSTCISACISISVIRAVSHFHMRPGSVRRNSFCFQKMSLISNFQPILPHGRPYNADTCKHHLILPRLRRFNPSCTVCYTGGLQHSARICDSRETDQRCRARGYELSLILAAVFEIPNVEHSSFIHIPCRSAPRSSSTTPLHSSSCLSPPSDCTLISALTVASAKPEIDMYECKGSDIQSACLLNPPNLLSWHIFENP